MGLSDQNPHFQELPVKQCTRAQLGLPFEEGDTESDYSKPPLFFEPHTNSAGDIKFYYKKLKCIETDKLNIQGDYNSAKGRSLVLEFKKCEQTLDNPITCKSDQDIKDWIKRKFILTFWNSRRFVLEEFGDGKVVPESRSCWVPLNS